MNSLFWKKIHSLPIAFDITLLTIFYMCSLESVSGRDQSPITIVSFGDSTTAPRKVDVLQTGRPAGVSTRGENVDDPKNASHNVVIPDDRSSSWLYVYSDVIRDKLQSQSDVIYLVDNEGISGARTDQALARLEVDILAKSPTWVVVQFGINDSWWDAGQPANLHEPDSSGSRVALNRAAQSDENDRLGNKNDHVHADRGNYADNLTKIVRSLKAKNVRVILMTPNQLAYDGDAKWRNLLLGQYAQVVREVARDEQVPLIDVWNLYAEYVSAPGKAIRDLLLDFEHPNAIGHRLVANALLVQVTDRKINLSR